MEEILNDGHLCKFQVFVSALTCVKHFNIGQECKKWCNVELEVLLHASAVKVITTRRASLWMLSSLRIGITVLSVLLERCSELWTERPGATFTCHYTTPNIPSLGTSSTTKGLVLSVHMHAPLSPLVSPTSKVGQTPPSVSHVRSPLLTLHWWLSLKVWIG